MVCFVDIGEIVDHHCLEQSEQSRLNSDDRQFQQNQQSEQTSLNSDGQQFHQYQQSEQS
jgi:hypothetical protein